MFPFPELSLPSSVLCQRSPKYCHHPSSLAPGPHPIHPAPWGHPELSATRMWWGTPMLQWLPYLQDWFQSPALHLGSFHSLASYSSFKCLLLFPQKAIPPASMCFPPMLLYLLIPHLGCPLPTVYPGWLMPVLQDSAHTRLPTESLLLPQGGYVGFGGHPNHTYT